MRIADVSEFYAPRGGGVKTYVHQKLDAAARTGHELVVIAPGPTAGIEERPGGRIRWIAGPPMPLDPRYTLLLDEEAVHRALDAEAPDLVEGSSPWTGGWFAARWPGSAPRVFPFHQDPVAVYPETLLDRWLPEQTLSTISAPFWAYIRSLAGRFDQTITSGHWLAERLRGVGIDNAVALPFGIDKARFSPTHHDAQLRTTLLRSCGCSDDAVLLLAVSRMHPEKRLGTVLDAFSRVRRTREAGLVLFGDGPLRPWIERQVARTEGVHLAGYTQDLTLLPRAYASADLFLHGSAAETYGLVVAEALCSGLPLVVPARGGAADLADPAWAATYAPGDAEGAARAVHELLARPRAALRAAAAEGGRARVQTMDDHFTQLFEHYAGLISSVGSTR